MVLEKTLESPLDCKEIKPVTPEEINSEYSLEGLMLQLQYFGHLMQRASSLEKTLMLGKIAVRRRRGQRRLRRLGGITNSINMSLSKLRGDGEGQGGPVCCSPWGRQELDMAEQLDNNLYQASVFALRYYTFFPLHFIFLSPDKHMCKWKNSVSRLFH